MGTLLDFKILESRGVLMNSIDAQNLRRSELGLTDLANRNTARLLGTINQDMITNNWGAPAKRLPVRNKGGGTATVGTMTCTFPTADSSNGFVNVTFFSAHAGFRIVPRVIDQTGGLVTPPDEFAFLFGQTEREIADLLETQIHTTLDAAKATTSASTFVGAASKYPLVGDTLQVSAAEQPLYYNFLKSIYQADDFGRTGIQVIGDAQMPSYVSQYINQGSGNSANTAFQFNNIEFSYSNDIVTTAATSAVSTAFAMAPGSLGILAQVSPDAKAGRTSKSKGIEWGVARSNLMGIDMEIMMSDDCADLTAITANSLDTNGYAEFYQMGINVAIITAYDQSTNGSIKKIDFL